MDMMETIELEDLKNQARQVLEDVYKRQHLDGEQWKEYKDDLVRHTTVWSGFSQKEAEIGRAHV